MQMEKSTPFSEIGLPFQSTIPWGILLDSQLEYSILKTNQNISIVQNIKPLKNQNSSTD